MNEKKSRALLFVLGISFGILIGAGAVYLSTPRPGTNGEVSENRIEQIVNKVFELVSLKKENHDSSATVPANKIATKSSTANDKSANKSSKTEKDSLSPEQSTAGLTADSVVKDSSQLVLNSNPESNEEIIVKKDELLLSKSIELVHMDAAQNRNEDSLLQSVSGVREMPKIQDAKNSFPVELWRSPINYKGYKLAKNKLVLFGLDEHAPLKLFVFADNTYLKYADAVYKLEDHLDFRAFEKVSNPQVISQISNH